MLDGHVEDQIKTFMQANQSMKEQLHQMEYGTIAFHVRDGKVYKATVEKSLLFTAREECNQS